MIPKLRFPEFEKGWEYKKLGEIGELTSSKRIYLSEYVDDGVPFYRGKEISELKQKNQPKDILYISSQLYNDYKNKYGVPKINDILITAVGTLGNILVIKDEEPFYFKDGNLIWFKNIIFDADFVAYLLEINKKSIELSAIGSSQKALTMVELKKLSFQFPSISEQNKIASFLLLVDERIQTQKKIIEQLETLMKVSRVNIFSQKLRFKDEHGNYFPSWERKKIKEILTIGSGKDYKHLNDGAIPVYGTGGIITFVDSFLYDGETVCIGRKGTIDKPLYYNGKIWTVDTLFYTHLFNDSVPKFVFNVFQNINWKEFNEASGVPSLSKNTIEKIEISIPCLKEQHKITNYLSSIQDKIETEKQILEKLELQKKFLLANLFF